MDYLERLSALGFKPHEALRIIELFKKYLTYEELEKIISEREIKDVGVLQS